MFGVAKNNKGKIEKNKKVKEGKCLFPFSYKWKQHDKCFPTEKGDICATSLSEKNTKRRTLKTYGYCTKKRTLKIKKKKLKIKIKQTKKIEQNNLNTKSNTLNKKMTLKTNKKLKTLGFRPQVAPPISLVYPHDEKKVNYLDH